MPIVLVYNYKHSIVTSEKNEMKIDPLVIPADKAQKELKRFLSIGYVCGILGLLVFWGFGAVALAFAARCLMLTFNSNLKTLPKLGVLRFASALLIVIGCVGFSFVLFS